MNKLTTKSVMIYARQHNMMKCSLMEVVENMMYWDSFVFHYHHRPYYGKQLGNIWADEEFEEEMRFNLNGIDAFGNY